MMNSGKLKKSTSLSLDKELYLKIEKLAKLENISVNNFIETVLFHAISDYEPNKETKDAIKEAREERKLLKRYDDPESLLQDLNKD